MMKKNQLDVEMGFYGLALLIATLIRALGLGTVPLSDQEAIWGLQALGFVKGGLQTVGNYPGYVLGTGLLFYLFEASNWLARILPALIGAWIAFVPYFYRRFLGRFNAVLLAFVLALSPALVANSRFIDGAGMVLTCLLLAGGFWLSGYPIAMGIALGWALLSGPRVWLGLMIFALVFIWNRFVKDTERNELKVVCEEGRFDWRKAVLALVLTLLLGGTLFFQVPAGLNGIPGSLIEFLRGWTISSSIGLGLIWLALLAYEPLAVFLGGWGLIHSLWRSNAKLDVVLSRAVLVSLFLVMVYPSHRVLDWGFVAVPLWALGVRKLSHLFQGRLAPGDWKELAPAWGMGAAVFTLLVFIWMSLGRLVNLQGITGDQQKLIGASIIVAIAMIMLIAILIAWGWSGRHSITGLVFSVLFVLLISNLAAAWNAAGLGRNPLAELWRESAYPTDHDLLVQTVYDTAERARGVRTELDVFVVDVDSPSLQWALRKINTVRFVKAISPELTPSLVITRDDQQLAFREDYTGQDFVWKETPTWDLLGISDWLRWVMFRYVPSGKEYLVVWVRSALMPGAGVSGAP